ANSGRRNRLDRLGHERERSSRDAAAARFFARVRWIEDRDACAVSRQPPCRARSRRPRADYRHIHHVIHYRLVPLVSRGSWLEEATSMTQTDTGLFTVAVFQDAA